MSKKSPVNSDNYYLYPEWFEGENGSNQSVPQPTSYGFYTIQASRKSPVASDNFCFYPDWFEGNHSNQSNQSQPSTSSYSYPTLEYIWSNAVRLTRVTHSNLQDEIEYIEANLGGGGNLSCNCSELEYKIDINSTKIYYNSVNITSNANKIANLSDIKLSRDGSQPMTGLLQCEAGLKTNTISTVSSDTLTCDKDLVVNSHIWGNPLLTIGSGADFPDAYPHIEFSYNNLVLITPGESGPLERIYIYGGWDDGEIMIKNADLAPFTDNRWDLGFPGYTWRCVYAAKGNFSGTIVPDAILTNSANISDLDARVDYLEENLSTCNCSALQFGIDSNTTEIANLSTIKLSRDGSQTMTGSLKCEAGLKTNGIANLSDNELSIIGATPSNEGSQIKLTASRISLLTANSNGEFTERLRIPGGLDTVVVYIKDADFAPFHDNVRNLGYAFLRWKEICGYIGNFSSIEVKSHIWSNNTFRIGHGASATEDTQIRFTSNDLTLMTPNSNGTSTERISLTGSVDDSIVYIKNAHLLPHSNTSQYLGSLAHKWRKVYAVEGDFSGTVIPDSIITLENKLENIGPYSVIVYKKGTKIYAKNASGNIIAQGDAGTDDATVLKTALESGGKIIIMPATYTLYFTISGSTDLITLPPNTVVDGLVRDETKLEFYLDGSTPSNYFNVAELVVRSNCVVRNLTIDGKRDYFEGKEYLQYLIAMREGDEKSKYDIIENVKLINSKRCGIVPDCSCSVIRNIIVDKCSQALDSDRVDNLLVEGFVATTCQNAFYFESDVINVTLRNFYFEPAYRGVYLPLSTATFRNIIIEDGEINFPSGLSGWDRYAFEVGAEVEAFTVRNVRITKQSAHPGAFRHLKAKHFGDVIIENCNVGYMDNIFTYGCSDLIIDGGRYKADYIFINSPTGFLVKNANIYTPWHVFHDSPSNIHFENCCLNSLGSDGTESGITFRRCTIGDKKSDNSGTATISSGNTSVVVSHGLFKAPVRVFLTGTHNEVAKCWVSDISDTEFTINAPSAVTDDRDIYWEVAIS